MEPKEIILDRDRLRILAPVADAPIRHHVFVCNGKSCSAAGSAGVMEAFSHALGSRGLQQGKTSKGRNPKGSVVLTDCSSVGFCSIGPAVLVYPDGVWYAQVRPADVPEIVEEHLINGRVVERLALIDLDPSATNG
ncbi:MAG: (2Fe-2S) ferredoxin domain-containing protein [Pyrinomonadaceae bacterium]